MISLEARASPHLPLNNHHTDGAGAVPRQSCGFAIQDVTGSSQKLTEECYSQLRLHMNCLALEDEQIWPRQCGKTAHSQGRSHKHCSAPAPWITWHQSPEWQECISHTALILMTQGISRSPLRLLLLKLVRSQKAWGSVTCGESHCQISILMPSPCQSWLGIHTVVSTTRTQES